VVSGERRWPSRLSTGEASIRRSGCPRSSGRSRSWGCVIPFFSVRAGYPDADDDGGCTQTPVSLWNIWYTAHSSRQYSVFYCDRPSSERCGTPLRTKNHDNHYPPMSGYMTYMMDPNGHALKLVSSGSICLMVLSRTSRNPLDLVVRSFHATLALVWRSILIGNSSFTQSMTTPCSNILNTSQGLVSQTTDLILLVQFMSHSTTYTAWSDSSQAYPHAVSHAVSFYY